jgi:hypothetical protein
LVGFKRSITNKANLRFFHNPLFYHTWECIQ